MTPAARIELNGRDVTTMWASVLVSITVTDEAGVKADTCEVAIDAREGFTAPPIGGVLRVWLGYDPAPIYMGSYKVDSWTKAGPVRLLTVSAKAADLTSEIKAPKTRSHHDTTVGAIVNKIAGEHGLSAVVDSAIGARTIEHIDQQTESDMGFLSRLAKRNGATFKLADGKVIFAAKGSKSSPSGGSKSPKVITPIQVSTWEATCSERGGYKAASAEYMDHAKGKRLRYKTGTGTPCHHDRRLYGSKAEAEAAAKANLGDLTRGRVAVSLDGAGNPFLYAEAMAQLEGFDPDVDGEYLVKNATHTYAGGGYTTRLLLETDGADSETDPA